MATGYYTINDHLWASIEALDEFGAGTLDGDPAHGGSNDGCGPAAIVNGDCAIKGKQLSYAEIGQVRANMITHGQWTAGATVGNPRTGGCEPAHLKWQAEQMGYDVPDWLDEQNATLSAQQIRNVIHYGGDNPRGYGIVMVFNASALFANEHGVQRHFVGIAGYGGDAGTPSQSGGTDEHGYGKIYVLNSDVAGQHGAAPGQWMWIDDLLRADPRAYVVMAPHPPTPPPPPPPPPASTPDIAGATVTLDQLQQMVDAAVTKALEQLKGQG